MDFKRMMTAMALSLLILMGWQKLFPPPEPAAAQQPAATAEAKQQAAALNVSAPLTVETDTVKALIDEKSGNLLGLTLRRYNATNDEQKPFVLFQTGKEHNYAALSSVVDEKHNNLLEKTSFSAAQKSYALKGDKLEVRLSAPEQNGLQVEKVYTFSKNSYLINVRFELKNTGSEPLKVGGDYQIVRDNSTPEGEGWFMHSYTGPVVYTPEGEFQKVEFSKLDDDFKSGRDTAEYQRKSQGGYTGMIQHYFMSAWVMQPEKGANACANGCEMSVKRVGENLYRAGVYPAAVEIAPGQSKTLSADLYAGPQITEILKSTAPNLELAKDYGRVHIFAAPLFALLKWLHSLIGNWGWAIVVLTLIVKIVLYPLNNAAYRSTAKMRVLAPKMEALKKKYGEDKLAMQQAMMQLYKDEKINPLGGCLPMLVQMPIFIGLYWMIFLSVELRQAPWLGWISDLSRPDPWYVLPAMMAATMWFQTKLNPAPTDPMQAQMMKIMPLVFSVMFFFFPSGLVLYYVVNNLLTIAQQWHINRRMGFAGAAPAVEVLDKEPAAKVGKGKKK